nr:hypothetical protein Iba_chr09aCG0260 [Ipomoea batatas]
MKVKTFAAVLTSRENNVVANESRGVNWGRDDCSRRKRTMMIAPLHIEKLVVEHPRTYNRDEQIKFTDSWKDIECQHRVLAFTTYRAGDHKDPETLNQKGYRIQETRPAPSPAVDVASYSLSQISTTTGNPRLGSWPLGQLEARVLTQKGKVGILRKWYMPRALSLQVLLLEEEIHAFVGRNWGIRKVPSSIVQTGLPPKPTIRVIRPTQANITHGAAPPVRKPAAAPPGGVRREQPGISVRTRRQILVWVENVRVFRPQSRRPIVQKRKLVLQLKLVDQIHLSGTGAAVKRRRGGVHGTNSISTRTGTN